MTISAAWRDLGLRQRFMIIVGTGIIIMVSLVVLIVAHYAEGAMDRKLQQLSANEITSLRTLIVNVMATRPTDEQDIGITVFNKWFVGRNADYPGKVWSVWGPKVALHIHEIDPQRPPKVAQDDLDREALATAKPVGRIVGGFYRYSMPIVLGVTEGANQPVCHTCHTAMGIEDGEVIAVLSSSLSIADERQNLITLILMLVVGGVLAGAVAILGVHWILGVMITNPTARMITVMGRLSGGDTAVDIGFQDRRDEIGDIARSVAVFKENAIEGQRLRIEREEAKGRADEERGVAMRRLASEFESGVSGVAASVAAASAEMEGSAQTLSTLAAQVSAQATAVADASHQAAANVQTVAAATEQLSCSVDEIGRQVAESSRVAESAVVDAAATDGIMHELAGAATRIGEVITLINHIASQTNLLALNATIEAARAGEAGKGFAVVAGEVKNLANQTAKATEEIAQQVGAVQSQTERAVVAIRNVTGTIGRISEIAAAITSTVGQQGEATREIARNVESAALGTRDVSQNISGTFEAARQADLSAGTVLDASKRLSADAQEMSTAVAGFVQRVRAG